MTLFSKNNGITVIIVISALIVIVSASTRADSLQNEQGLFYGTALLCLLAMLRFQSKEYSKNQKMEAELHTLTHKMAEFKVWEAKIEASQQSLIQRRQEFSKNLCLYNTWLEFPQLLECAVQENLPQEQADGDCYFHEKMQALIENKTSIPDILRYLYEQEGGFTIQVQTANEGVDLPTPTDNATSTQLTIPSYTINSLLTTKFYVDYFKSILFFNGKSHVCKIPYDAIIENSIQPIKITPQDRERIIHKKERFHQASFTWKQTEAGILILVKFKNSPETPYSLFIAEPGLPDREIVLHGTTLKTLHELIGMEYGQ